MHILQQFITWLTVINYYDNTADYYYNMHILQQFITWLTVIIYYYNTADYNYNMHILSGHKSKNILHDHKIKQKNYYIYIKTVPIKKVHLYFFIFHYYN